MITVDLNLFRFGNPDDKHSLGKMKIWNDASGNQTRGNYKYVIFNKRGTIFRKGEIKNFPRKRLLGWDLVYRILEQEFGGRNGS